jgi:hypothetical protein
LIEATILQLSRRLPHSIFFSAFNALAIDDGGGGTGFPANRFAAFYIELMMYEIERAIPTPQVEIIVQR